MRSTDPWRISIDTGGTFTDCVARPPQGEENGAALRRVKILSSSALRGRIVSCGDQKQIRIEAAWLRDAPSLEGFSFHLLGRSDCSFEVLHHIRGDDRLGFRELPDARSLVGSAFELRTGEPAPVLASRLATQTPLSEELPPIVMRLATTRGTNALLERAGASVAFFVTEGIADLLEIGDQQRPDLFTLDIHKPPPLYTAVVEVRGRLDSRGSVLVPLDVEGIRQRARDLVAEGTTTAAIALMHSYRNSEHEEAVAAVLREEGFEHVAVSAELAPLIEIVPRAETANVEAYLAPIIADYLNGVTCAIHAPREEAPPLHIMTSAGGLVRADRFHAKDSLLSGPAGGVAGAAAAGRAAGFERIIGFDMGGTSTDVARYDSDFEYRFEHRVGHARLVAPALAIETVAAGGGSICGFRDGRLHVGPESARADPGPACYGAGGPLTLTDVNLLLGRIDPELFEVPVDRSRSEEALARVISVIETHADEEQDSEFESSPDRDALLDGFLAIANERMAGAIRQVSFRRGYDPAGYALVSFGGAGGQHACAIASMLGIRSIVMPADASLLSAVGLDVAVIERFSQRQVLALFDELGDDLDRIFNECAKEAISEVVAEGIEEESVNVRRRIANVRLLGQDASIAVEVDQIDSLSNEFSQRYEEMYGHRPEGRPIEIESIRVVASSTCESSRYGSGTERLDESTGQGSEGHAITLTRARFDGTWKEVPTYRRSQLAVGETIEGPALIFDRSSSYVIESSWSAEVDENGSIVAKLVDHETSQAGLEDKRVRLELFANRFTSIAEEMGQILQRTALSTNVKRRLDFSCAVLDRSGELVVNAPHIPVHLGALGLCVRSVAEAVKMRPGDVIVTNHPAFGGSHLPDVTVITPIFHEQNLSGYVANRAHHAEIGGSRPGSMPPMANRLIEEGVVIRPTHIVREGRSQFEAIEKLLRAGAFPSRAVNDNLADLRAAVAANHRGAVALSSYLQLFGPQEVASQMEAIKEHAAVAARAALRSMRDGRYAAEERLDDGTAIRVDIRIAASGMTIDFTGSAEQHPGNLNATPAIVRSAIIYVLRLLMGEAGKAAGLNEGIMRDVHIVLPPGMLNPDFNVAQSHVPAVVGGNVETSQRLVDTLIKALGLAACSQGTMNNVLFGNEKFGYYETICGGAGATGTSDGADAVHTHMTNTRITDPELLEQRYPVRLERFAIRKGSGGQGRRRGGDGVVREIAFLEPMSLSILSQHRVERPFGLLGGLPGAPGAQRIVRGSGEEIVLGPIDQCEVECGDRLIVETPGGGGHGSHSVARRPTFG